MNFRRLDLMILNEIAREIINETKEESIRAWTTKTC